MVGLALQRMQRFFASWRFPVLTIAILMSYLTLTVVMLLVPASAPGLGGFAEEFKTWCFGYDAATGKMEWAYVAMMLLHPVVISLVIGTVWLGPIRAVFQKTPRAPLPYLGAAAVLVVAASVSLVGMQGEAQASELPFPAEALRTHMPAPEIVLTNHEGERVDVGALEGRVVVLTGIYATCRHTCPMIMAQSKSALAKLTAEERAGVSFVAVTLNPEHDDQAVLAELADAHRVSAPGFQFLTGEPKRVNAVLDRLQIAREMDMTSGEINHANLFVVLDKRGRIAYRLTLGKRQERWLVQAMRILLKEPGTGGA